MIKILLTIKDEEERARYAVISDKGENGITKEKLYSKISCKIELTNAVFSIHSNLEKRRSQGAECPKVKNCQCKINCFLGNSESNELFNLDLITAVNSIFMEKIHVPSHLYVQCIVYKFVLEEFYVLPIMLKWSTHTEIPLSCYYN